MCSHSAVSHSLYFTFWYQKTVKRLMALVEMTACFLSLGESCSSDLIEFENTVEAVEDVICFVYSRNGWFCSGKAVERVRWAVRVLFHFR